tara:strand:+ start:498 stop:986 length:489 start_codon:yes stop_codon:yes gene_type:complete
MIDKFIEWYTGSFNNKQQSLSRPFMFKEVNMTHKYLGDNTFYGEQQTVYTGEVYRKFKIRLEESDGLIVSKNYSLDDEYIPGCDTFFKFENDEFTGSLNGCDCIVDWEGEKTYLKNAAILREDKYHVYDRGLSVETDKFVWGSRYGYFEFVRTDKEPLLISG